MFSTLLLTEMIIPNLLSTSVFNLAQSEIYSLSKLPKFSKFIVTGTINYATGKQFHYSKFKNDSDDVSQRKSPKSVNVNVHANWPSVSGHTKVHKKESNEKPLIDLSDETENSYGHSDSKVKTTSSEISSLFDALCASNTQRYGNIDLAQPLVKDPNYVSDPFEISDTFSDTYSKSQKSITSTEVKVKRTPPSRPKPIVYRRTTSVESQQSGGSPQSYSPLKFSGIKSLPLEYHKKDNLNAIEASVSSDKKVSAASLSAHSSPNKQSLSLKHLQNREGREDSTEYQRDFKNQSETQAPNGQRYVKDQPRVVEKDQPRTVEKAFDWLNDALSDLTSSNMGKAGSDPTLSKPYFSRYDQTPDELTGATAISIQPTVYTRHTSGFPVQYCEVPQETTTDHSNQPSEYPPRYDEVPKYDDPNDVKLPIAKDIYSPQSTTSTYSDWDDFDSDPCSEEEEASEKPRRTSPPPLPPRDYFNSGEGQEKQPRSHIFPILQDGQQMSHTHYFLIPPKHEKSHPGDRRTAKSTAQVRPFTIDGMQMDESGHSYNDYQNVLGDSRFVGQFHASEHDMWTGQPVDMSQTFPQRKSSYKYSISEVHSGDRNDRSHQDKIKALHDSVIGLTDEECHAALCHCNWNVERSVKHLKLEHLLRLGIAPRDHCRRLLEALNWNLELASTVILDEYKVGPKISMESAV